jgi:DNA-binding CsgD family transcriptional regulator
MVNAELLWDIYKRSRAGVSNRQIAQAHGLDKKTVNQYLASVNADLILPAK